MRFVISYPITSLSKSFFLFSFFVGVGVLFGCLFLGKGVEW